MKSRSSLCGQANMQPDQARKNAAKGLVSVAICIILSLNTAYPQQNMLLEAEARKLLDHFINKESGMLTEMLADDLKSHIPDGQLEEIADGLKKQLGEFKYADIAGWILDDN